MAVILFLLFVTWMILSNTISVTSNSWLLFFVVPSALGIATFLALFGLMYEIAQKYKAASSELHIEIAPRDYPPRDDKKYRSWCQRYKVEPYAMSQD
jgi:hypothetical protein